MSYRVFIQVFLSCNCDECKNLKKEHHFVSDKLADCFRQARKRGWRIYGDSECYAPNH